MIDDDELLRLTWADDMGPAKAVERIERAYVKLVIAWVAWGVFAGFVLGMIVGQDAAAETVSYVAGPVNVAYNDRYGTGSTPQAAMDSLAAAIVSAAASVGSTGWTEYTVSVSAPLFAGGVYTATGALGGNDPVSSVAVNGTCPSGCTGDSGNPSQPSTPGSIPLDGSQVGFWILTSGSVIAFALGFIGGRMR